MTTTKSELTKHFLIKCPVCWEKIPSDKFIVCGCDFSCCETCNQKNIILSFSEASCMNLKCKIKWTDRFLAENFDRKWHNGNGKGQYRYVTKQKLIEREKSHIPDTLETLVDMGNFVDEWRYWKKYKQSIGMIEPKKDFLYICPCPSECNGLINDDYMCLVCKLRVCEKCREIENKNHKCNPQTVATVKFLSTSKGLTKPCPKCATPIFKINGCDQMFCGVCHITFSWNFGSINEGVIHNPHAIAWMRTIGQQNNPKLLGNDRLNNDRLDNRCEVPSANKYDFLEKYLQRRRIAELDTVLRSLRFILDVLGFEDIQDRIRYIYGVFKHQTKTRSLSKRKKSPEKEITNKKIKNRKINIKPKNKSRLINESEEEHSWALNLFFRERKRLRLQTMVDIIEMMRSAGISELWKFVDDMCDRKKRDLNSRKEFEERMEKLRIFVNETMRKELSLLGKKKIPKIIWENEFIYFE